MPSFVSLQMIQKKQSTILRLRKIPCNKVNLTELKLVYVIIQVYICNESNTVDILFYTLLTFTNKE